MRTLASVLTAHLLTALMLAAPLALAQSTSGQEKQILIMTKNNWVAFRNYKGRQLIYFTHLEAWRCGIQTVKYSINSEALDKEWELPPCDPENPHAVTSDKPYISLPLGTADSVSLQLTFTDGSQSEMVTRTP